MRPHAQYRWLCVLSVVAAACSSSTCPSGRVGGTGACVSGPAPTSSKQNASARSDAAAAAADSGAEQNASAASDAATPAADSGAEPNAEATSDAAAPAADSGAESADVQELDAG